MGQDLSPKFLTYILCLSALVFFPPAPGLAQTVTQAAGLAAPIENLEGSARDLGFGSAFVGVADDSSAIYFNPAGLSGLQTPEIALHHNSYLAGTFQETLEAGFPAGKMGGWPFPWITWVGGVSIFGTLLGIPRETTATATWGSPRDGGWNYSQAFRGPGLEGIAAEGRQRPLHQPGR